jgi:hypothetical protein
MGCWIDSELFIDVSVGWGVTLSVKASCLVKLAVGAIHKLGKEILMLTETVLIGAALLPTLGG